MIVRAPNPPRIEYFAAGMALLVGVGVVGAPLGRALFDLGVVEFVPCDPKSYRPENIGSQCDEGELARPKAHVVAERLRRRGARATGVAVPIESLDRGHVRPGMFAVVVVDRLSAQRAAHDFCHESGIPLYRVNIDPSTGTILVAAFRYDRGSDLCALCNWTPEEFAEQRAERSCAPDGERPTRSSRPLAEAAAALAALAIQASLDDAPGALGDGESLLIHPASGTSIRSRIERSERCPTDHEARVTAPIEIDASRLSLAALADRAGFDPTCDLRVRGSGDIGTEVGCCACDARWTEASWLVGEPRLDRCLCGGATYVPLLSRAMSRTREELGGCWERPLTALGMRFPAWLELDDGTRRRSFRLVGGEETP